ncbi:MAG TPA: hypothetical protein VNZ45_10595 [Bacteroidia bacterium]|jgi:hypothetical protein|nr:hypothetical protein [Bacteroidia bacterium]
MTPREWGAWMDGFSLREEGIWRRLRVMYALIYNANVESYHQRKPEELMPLPSDKKEQISVKVLNDEEREALAKKYKF